MLARRWSAWVSVSARLTTQICFPRSLESLSYFLSSKYIWFPKRPHAFGPACIHSIHASSRFNGRSSQLKLFGLVYHCRRRHRHHFAPFACKSSEMFANRICLRLLECCCLSICLTVCLTLLLISFFLRIHTYAYIHA